MDISGVILSGGDSKRMGKNKCLLKINNKTFINLQTEKLNKLCTQVFISVSKKNDYKKNNIIVDKFYDIGPVSGIYSSLKKITTGYAVFLPCDMPLISMSILKTIIENIGNYDAVVPVCNKKIFPVSAVYSKKCIKTLKNNIAKKDYKLLNFLNNINVKYLRFDNNLKHFFNNVNTQTDYKNLLDESNKNL